MSETSSAASLHPSSTVTSFSVAEKGADKQKTDWRSVIIANAILLLCSVEHHISGMGEWPYMKTLDPEATSSFFGAVTAVTRFGHIAFILIFAIWSHKKKVIKYPLLVGRFISFIGCILYLSVEYFPHNRRYLLLVCYLIFGMGFSSQMLFRGYLSLKSSPEDRSRAFALHHLAIVVSVVLGPVTQLAFSSIKYPGYEVIPGMRFHIFSAPIYFAIIVNIIAIAFICYFFEDPTEFKKKGGLAETKWELSIDYFRQQWAKLRKAPFPWPLVFLVLIQKVSGSIMHSTMHAIVGPMFMTVFALNASKTAIWMAIAQCTSGSLGFIVALMLMFLKLAQRMSKRLMFSIASFLLVAFFLLNYPYKFLGKPLQPYNATTHTGCDSDEYSWCETAYDSSLYTFVPVKILIMGFGMPMAHVSLDTIFSKILGNIDQTLMQGMFVAVEDVFQIAGPLYAAGMFTAYGTGPLFLADAVIVGFAAILWLVFWKKMKPYD